MMNNFSLKDANKCAHGRPNLPAATVVNNVVVSDDICSRFMFYFEYGLDVGGMLCAIRGPVLPSSNGYPHPFQLYGKVNSVINGNGLGHLWGDEATKETLSVCLKWLYHVIVTMI